MDAAGSARSDGIVAAATLVDDAEAIRCRELRRSRGLRGDAVALASADLVTRHLVARLLAPVVAYLVANKDRPDVVARVRTVVPLLQVRD
jgi:hypothetical protein